MGITSKDQRDRKGVWSPSLDDRTPSRANPALSLSGCPAVYSTAQASYDRRCVAQQQWQIPQAASGQQLGVAVVSPGPCGSRGPNTPQEGRYRVLLADGAYWKPYRQRLMQAQRQSLPFGRCQALTFRPRLLCHGKQTAPRTPVMARRTPQVCCYAKKVSSSGIADKTFTQSKRAKAATIPVVHHSYRPTRSMATSQQGLRAPSPSSTIFTRTPRRSRTRAITGRGIAIKVLATERTSRALIKMARTMARTMARKMARTMAKVARSLSKSTQGDTTSTRLRIPAVPPRAHGSSSSSKVLLQQSFEGFSRACGRACGVLTMHPGGGHWTLIGRRTVSSLSVWYSRDRSRTGAPTGQIDNTRDGAGVPGPRREEGGVEAEI